MPKDGLVDKKAEKFYTYRNGLVEGAFDMENIRSFLKEHKWILLIVGALFLERVAAMCYLGVGYGPTMGGDTVGYMNSGIEFAKSGMITIYAPYPTAMIMPAITVVLGTLSALFGEGTAYWLSAKLLWAAMGACTAWFVYRSVLMFWPKWCALLSACVYFLPNLVWMDNIILTETPYNLCFAAAVYFTLAMGRSDDKKYFLGYLAAVWIGTLFRIMIIVLPIFSGAYLLFLKRRNCKMLFKRLAIIILAMLVFAVPWTARNYHHFETFIPLTYGAGNAKLLGTYQGIGYPADEELDYDVNVEQVYQERYDRFLDEQGYPRHHNFDQYLTLEYDNVKAEYRMDVWWENNPLSMLFSYLIYKPLILVINVFYYDILFGIPKFPMLVVRGIDLLLCCAGVLLCFLKKRNREEICFLTVVYWAYIFTMATSYATIRYAEPLMCLRYIIAAFGFSMLVELWKKKKLQTK